MEPAIYTIIVFNLALGITGGFIMHRSDFCVAGMFRDFFLFRHSAMLRALLLLILTSMILFELGRRLGIIRLYPFPLLGSPSLVNLAGGTIFGIGMVLAGGCVVGTLYRMGSGSVTSAAAFVGLLIGSGVYAEIHPWWKGFATQFLFQKDNITLAQAIAADPGLVLLPCILGGAFLTGLWTKQEKWDQSSMVSGYMQPWKAALLLALLGFLSYLVTGMPLGISTAYAKMAAFMERLVLPDHVAGLAFFQELPLNYIIPFTGTPLTGGAGPNLDGIAFIQFPLVIGIILGAFVSAVLVREFSIYVRIPARQYISALAGGILLALGSRMTPGCNIWHLFGGLPILAMQSLLFLAGLVPGAWIGTILLSRLILTVPREAAE